MSEVFYIYTLDDVDSTDPSLLVTGGITTISSDAEPDILSMTDDDPLLDVLTSGDTGQVLDQDLYIEGVLVGSAGDSVSIGGEASVLNFSDGLTTGNFLAIVVNGNVIGFASTVELNPDDAIAVGPATVGGTATNYDNLVACFTRGTKIETAKGAVLIEDLQTGDLVKTRDHGMQPIRWTGSQKVAGKGALAPIRIKAGALGNSTDLLVSPMHRMLISGPRAEVLFGQEAFLAHVNDLRDGDRIFSEPCAQVEYFHIMFDQHETISAHGCWSESFAANQSALTALDEKSRAELLNIFPQLDGNWDDSLPTLSTQEAGLIASH